MLEKNSNGAVLQTVSQTPGSIGYVSIGFVSKDVKALPIWYNAQKFVAPTIDNVKTRAYPISRDLYVIKRSAHRTAATSCILFLKVRRLSLIGYVPDPDSGKQKYFSSERNAGTGWTNYKGFLKSRRRAPAYHSSRNGQSKPYSSARLHSPS
jgi:hypothetical protein